MANPRNPTEYQALVRKCRPRQAAPKSVEEQLDALLGAAERNAPVAEEAAADARTIALDTMRQQMRSQLLPVFADLRAKYEPAGIRMEIDADDFIAGGVQLTVEVQYGTYGMRLDGTATAAGIAFHETRFSNAVLGVVTTGPMLRARNLSGQTFREFLCDRVGQLVRSALRRRQGPSA